MVKWVAGRALKRPAMAEAKKKIVYGIKLKKKRMNENVNI